MTADVASPAEAARQALLDRDIDALVAAVAETSRIPASGSTARQVSNVWTPGRQVPEHTRERPTALCACVEPHAGGTPCAGPAGDARTALEALALRLVSAKDDPIYMPDDFGPDSRIDLIHYGITEPELDFMVALLGTLLRGGARG